MKETLVQQVVRLSADTRVTIVAERRAFQRLVAEMMLKIQIRSEALSG